MDTCVHSLEYEADACPERLKDVKEQANLNEFRIRLMISNSIDEKYSHLG